MNNGDFLKAIFEHGIECIENEDDNGLASTLNAISCIINMINEEESK